MKSRGTAATAATPPAKGIPRRAWWTVFLAFFMFAVPLTSPWWSMVLRGEMAGPDEDADPAAKPDAKASPEVQGSTFRIVLHTRTPGKPGLSTVEREIPYVRGVVPQILAVVTELGIGTPEAAPLLPQGTRVLDAAYTERGTVYIDFSPELDTGRGVGVDEERALIQGIVTTITDNFAAVRRVLILVGGKAPVLWHLDLTHAFTREDPIFAVEGTPEPANPGPVSVRPDAGPKVS